VNADICCGSLVRNLSFFLSYTFTKISRRTTLFLESLWLWFPSSLLQHYELELGFKLIYNVSFYVDLEKFMKIVTLCNGAPCSFVVLY